MGTAVFLSVFQFQYDKFYKFYKFCKWCNTQSFSDLTSLIHGTGIKSD